MQAPVNPDTVALIKQFEGLHDGDLSRIGLQPKMCPAGVWTVGYGRALRGADGQFLRGDAGRAEAYRQYDTLTESQAEQMLIEDLLHFAARLRRLVRVEVTENQFGALVSLAYNIGLNAFAQSTALRQTNQKNWLAAADAFLLWTKSQGKTLNGLIRRRKAERELFLR